MTTKAIKIKEDLAMEYNKLKDKIENSNGLFNKLKLINTMVDTYRKIYYINFDLSFVIMSQDMEEEELELRDVYEEHLDRLVGLLSYFVK